MILVDMSVWINHLRRGNARLRTLLQEGEVICHPSILGELACGNLRDRSKVLKLLSALPSARETSHAEVLHLLESNRLYGLGLGWIDAHLLASALLTRCPIWTLDKTLHAAATKLRLT